MADSAQGSVRQPRKLERFSSQKKLNRRLSWQTARRRSSREHLPFWRRQLKASREKVKHVAVAYTKSRPCMFMSTCATLASCVFYVVGTYLSDKNVIISFEGVFACLFFTDYVLSLLASPMPSCYAFGAEGIIDLLSVLPVFGAIRRWIYTLSFIRYLRLMKAIRITRNHRFVDRIVGLDDATFKAGLLGVKVAGLILMTTAIIYATEHAVDDTDDEEGAFSDDSSAMKWHDALYYTTVTLSTVGYGDVLPVQTYSRLLMVLVILFALTYVPVEIGQLVDVISSRPKYRRGFSTALLGQQLHVLLAMVPKGMDNSTEGFNAENLGRCLVELFHNDHGLDNESLWVVIMAACPPSTDVVTLLRSPRFSSRVLYYRGSVLDPRDMAAVCAEYADCIFLYPETMTGGVIQQAKERVTLAAKALQRYLDRTPTDPDLMAKVEKLSTTGTVCRTIVTVRELSSKDQLLRFGIDRVICHDELKMAMLANGTLFPAFLPFVINTMRSASSEAPVKREERKYRNGDVGNNNDADERSTAWLEDYTQGMEYEVYSLPMRITERSHLRGMSFKSLALHLYDQSNGEVILMAVVTEIPADVVELAGGDAAEQTDDANSRSSYVYTTIFPGDEFTFKKPSYVLVLAEDKQKAEDYILAIEESSTTRPESEASGASVDRSGLCDPAVNPTTSAGAAEAAADPTAICASFCPVQQSDSSAPSSPIGSATSSADIPRRRGSYKTRGSVQMTEEELTHLESVRKEMRKEDDVRWTRALADIEEAYRHLKELEGDGPVSDLTEDKVSENPVSFFAKVERAAESLKSALRAHNSALPDDLEGHLVLVGSHPRLQHFVLALRRQRPTIPVVVVTNDEDMFFELIEHLVHSKCRQPNLNISRIYHVFGKTEDTETFEEAMIGKAEAVVLMSDEPDDSEVLLVSFELEQLLEGMEAGENTPKVLIDLRKDGSIYYCGHTLSRGGPGTSSSRRGVDTRQLQDLSLRLTFDEHSPAAPSSGVWEWPLFAAGRVWTESIMDVVAVQTYFSMEILAFLETLLQIRRPVLVGSQLVDAATAVDVMTAQQLNTIGGDAENGNEDDGTRSWARGQFDQLKVSHTFKDKTYGDLVRNLITRGAIPIGLYRPAGTKGSTLPYAHVNPSPDEPLAVWPRVATRAWGQGTRGGSSETRTLVEGDSVFVLRSRQCRVFDCT